MTAQAQSSEWRRGWPLLIAAGVGLANVSLVTVTIGLFMRPFHEEFGWTRTEVAAAASVIGMMQVLLAPTVGRALDRWGARRVGLIGVVLFCASMASLATVGPGIWTYWLRWCVVGVAVAMSGVLIWMRAVAGRFTRSRALAMALALTGMSLGNYIFASIGGQLLASHGWRFTYLALSLGYLCLVLPAAWLMLYDTREVAAAKPPAGRLIAAQALAAGETLEGATLKEAMRTRQFWLIAVAMMLAAGTTTGLIVHLIPLHVDSGLTTAKAASIVGLIGAGGLCGKVFVGFLLDRFPPALIAAAVVAIPIVSFAIFLSGVIGSSPLLALTAVLLLGVSSGSEADVLSYITARYFGLRHYGVIYGFLTRCYSIGSTCAPLLIGLAFDHFGNYQLALTLLLALCGVGGVAMASLGRPIRSAAH